MTIRGDFVSIRFALLVLVTASFTGCDKKRTETIVTAKEHIDAAENTPSPSPEPTPGKAKDGTQKSSSRETVYKEAAPLADDEIEVDGRVMKKQVRGTSRDPRATKEEQWRVTVHIPAAKQSHTIQTDRGHYDRVKVGDRIKVVYRVGQFTSVVWYADIED
jgi:hypothetical protein